MNETIHKANYKSKVSTYVGLGQYELKPTTVCRGGKGYYSKRPPRGLLARNWKHVTCKHCLRHAPANNKDLVRRTTTGPAGTTPSNG